MANEKLVVCRDQQNCKRRLVPIWPKTVAQVVADPKRFGQTDAIYVTYLRVRLRADQRRKPERQQQENRTGSRPH